MKPCFLFNGDLWDQLEEYKKFQNILLDVFHGQKVDSINLAVLEHVISVSAGPLAEGKGATKVGTIYFRVYTIQLKKSGERTPKVELQEMGPSLDLSIRRTRMAPDEVMRRATRIPKEV